MEIREHQSTGAKTSLLGFGCMRFPMETAESGKNDWGKESRIDRVKSQELIDAALAGGIDYFDTAWPYHSGESEIFVGEALKKHDRKSFSLATKLPSWEIKTLDDAKRIFAQQLENLQTDYIDFYLLHALSNEGANAWSNLRDLGVVEWAEELQKQGKIKYLGFSFHDDYAAFEEIAKFRKWDFCQIQLNYLDTDYQAGVKGVELTEKLGIPLVIMEPLRGGALTNLPPAVLDIFKEADPNASAASWGLRFVASFSNVKVILSGMSNLEQLNDNLNTFNNYKPLSDAERGVILKVSAELKARMNSKCTGCRYCMPCPAGVDIPLNFHLWNEWGLFRMKEGASWKWLNMIGDDVKGKNCVSCGVCESACPQGIKIREDLQKVQKEFDDLCGIA